MSKKRAFGMQRNPWWFKAILFIVSLVLCTCTLYPVWDVFIGSFMPLSEYLSTTIKIFPRHFTLNAYKDLFDRSNTNVLLALRNTVFVTIIGTVSNVFIINMSGYVLSRKYFYGKGVIMKIILFSMIFSGGLIPSYLNAFNLGLIDTIWVLIMIPLVDTYYLIITRTYYKGITDELEEAAKIDGAGDFSTFIRIYVPVAKPIIATMVLFIAVNRWNNYSNNLYYTHSFRLDTLSMMLYRMLNNTDKQVADVSADLVADKSRRMAGIVFTILPLICFYPFLQKHFAKGVLIGSIKG